MRRRVVWRNASLRSTSKANPALQEALASAANMSVEEFAEVSELVRQKKESLAEVERKIAALQAQFEETNTRKEELARQVDDRSEPTPQPYP